MQSMGKLAHFKSFTWGAWCSLTGQSPNKKYIDVQTDKFYDLQESHVGQIVFRHSNEWPGLFVCSWGMDPNLIPVEGSCRRE